MSTVELIEEKAKSLPGDLQLSQRASDKLGRITLFY